MGDVQRILASMLSAAVLMVPVAVRAADDAAALVGLKEVKVAFDVKEGDAKLLLNRLNVIDESKRPTPTVLTR